MAKTIVALGLTAAALTALLAHAATAFAAEPTPAPTAKADAAPEATATPKADDAPKKEDAPKTADAPKKEAAPATSETPAWETAPPTRRGGFTVGLALGASVGNITGYPGDIEKRGKAAFRTDMGAAFGGGGTLFLGGALSDWLVFGVGGGGGRSQGGGVIVQGFSMVFHTEVFPLFWLDGVWRDLGISLDTGGAAYTGELENKPAGDAGKLVANVIDGGFGSRVGVGAFYDGIRLWKMSTGPFVAFDYTWSATIDQPLFLIGWRTALYLKAPTKKK